MPEHFDPEVHKALVFQMSRRIAQLLVDSDEDNPLIHMEALMGVFCAFAFSLKDGLTNLPTPRTPVDAFDLIIGHYRQIVAAGDPADEMFQFHA